MRGGEADARMMETRSVEVPCAASSAARAQVAPALRASNDFASSSWSGFGASRLQHFTVGSNDVRDGDDWAQMSGENIARGRPRIIFMFQEDAAC